MICARSAAFCWASAGPWLPTANVRLFSCSALDRGAQISLDHLVDVVLARFARPGVIDAAVRDVVGDDANAEERDIEKRRDLRRRRGLHLLHAGSEGRVEPGDAIDLIVPDVARADHPFDNPPAGVGALRLSGRSQ